MSPSDRGLPESIRHRLRNRLRDRGEDVQFGLQRYAGERFLYRLGLSPHRERFVLKGAALFALWGGSEYRPTRDLDFTGFGSSEIPDVLATFRDLCATNGPEDGLIFDPETLSAEPIRDDSEYQGLRVCFQARLGDSRIDMQVDIGFGNAIEPAPIDSEYPTLLGDPAPRIRAYPQDAVVAEKLHAMAILGEGNSRLKDFYDLYVMAGRFEFDGRQLGRSIAATFERRRTTIDATLPVALTPRFYENRARAGQWRAYRDRNRLPGAPADFVSVGDLLRAFLISPWDAMARRQPFDTGWPRGGPWGGQAGTRTEVASRPEGAVERRVDEGPPARAISRGARRGVDARGAPRRYNAYPAYKESGVEWLGEVPAEWTVKRLKTVAFVSLSNVDKKTVEGEEPVQLCNYLDVYRNDRITSGIEFMQATATRHQLARFQLRHGDVLITKDSEDPDDIAVPAAVAEDLPGVACGYHLALVRPKPSVVHGPYLARAFSADGLRDQFHVAACGITRFGLGGDAIGSSVFPIPPLEEQRAIAAFLDRETAWIDALVAKKERLIEQLQEKRTTLITRAVTKGLDPNVLMKDSGVEWLGEIPAEWTVKRLKTVASVLPSSVDKKTVEGEEPVQLCNYLDVYRNDRITSGIDFMQATATSQQLARFQLRLDDVLITKDSENPNDIAVPAVVAEDLPGVVCGYHLALVRPKSSVVHGPYLAHAFSADGLRDQFHVAACGITRFGLGGDVIGSSVFPIPPWKEQRAIAAFLDRETAKLDALIAKVREAIDRLKEMRMALISAAVTGKIDVREDPA